MVDHMKAIAQKHQELTAEERNLFCVAYKNVIGPKLSNWRSLSTKEKKSSPEKLTLIHPYMRMIEKELEDVCTSILGVIKNEILPYAESEEGKVFYHALEGDFCRYVSLLRNSVFSLMYP